MKATTQLWRGIEVWVLQTPLALARISRFGGQLLSWQPAGQEEVLWCSEQLQPPRPLRGGVPLCWPWFGRHPHQADAPSHGLARTAGWQLQQVQRLEDGRCHVRLVPEHGLHPGLVLTQQLWIGQSLEQVITSHNVSDRPQPLSQALHTYLRVDDVRSVRVLGLQGCRYIDALQAGQCDLQQGIWAFDPQLHAGRCDRIYLGVDGPVQLHDARRRLQLQMQGGSALVLWTPGPELAGQMDDVGAQWPHYLCLEAANAHDDARLLAPGQQHQLRQLLQVLPAVDAGNTLTG